MAIDINIEGVISAGDAFPVKVIDANVTKDVTNKLIGTVFEHLITARELDIKKYRLFISVASVQKIGIFDLNDTMFLGKVFADDGDFPDGCDILLKRHELGVAAYWDKPLEKLYNKVIEYKGLFFDANVLNNLGTGRELDIEAYIHKVATNANRNAVTKWLGG